MAEKKKRFTLKTAAVTGAVCLVLGFLAGHGII